MEGIVKLSINLIKYRSIRMYGVVWVQLHAFLTLASAEGEWWSGELAPGERPQVHTE
jgi:hypothetical protein